MQSWTILFVQNEAIEDGEYLLPVGTDTPQVVSEAGFKIACFHPLLDHGMRHVDVLPEGVYIMPAEE